MAAQLLAGPAIRLLLIVGLVAGIALFADFGALFDQVVTMGENFISGLISPF
jgi:uncharacterized ion transporter superfamily protein YfcC